MTWSAPIWIYLWLAGMAGGAYFAAFLVGRFAADNTRALLRLAIYLGVPMAVIGVLLLVVDLGRPLSFWHLFTQFKPLSPMSMGTWILLAWVAIAVVMAVSWWFENRLSKAVANTLRGITGFLGWTNLVLAVLLVAYTGVLLAVSSQSLWAGTILLPALFVASAISTGVALLIIVALAVNAVSTGRPGMLKLAVNQVVGSTKWTIPSRMVVRLAEADAIIIVIELVVLVGYVIWLATSAMAGAGEALRIITTGTLAAPFWAGVVLLALLVPFGLEMAARGKPSQATRVWRTALASSVCVILGGLILRWVITSGGQL